MISFLRSKFAGSGRSQEEVELPAGVRKIDCSFQTILKTHSMRGPFCHVGALINKDDVPDDMVARWRKMFLKIDPAGFTGIDLERRAVDPSLRRPEQPDLERGRGVTTWHRRNDTGACAVS